MATTKQSDPKVVTVYGRLSFPTFTPEEAYERSLKGSFPAKSVAEAKPDFQVLLEPSQLAKLKAKIVDEFFPYAVAQDKADEKKDRLNEKEVKSLLAQLEDDDFDGPLNMPVKAVHEKTAELAPECVATLKVIGNAGSPIEQRAIVRSEEELAVNDGSVLTFPQIVPINDSVHELYPGCYVAVTVNLYAYHNGKNAGFSAGGNVAVFRNDGDRFGGGVSVDEDEMFLED